MRSLAHRENVRAGCGGGTIWSRHAGLRYRFRPTATVEPKHMTKSTEAVSIPLDPGWDEIREGVRRICERFPNDYWVKLDHESAYPTEFVDALTEAGYLGALIPEEYGGAGLPLSAGCAILETIHESGLQRGGLPRADVHHGHGAAARQRGAEAEVPAGHRLGRAAPAGVRRHRADHRLRHHPAQDARRQEGQRPLRRQRPEGVDQPRAALRPDAAAGPHHAGRQGEEALRGAVGVPGRPARGQGQGRRDHARSTP